MYTIRTAISSANTHRRWQIKRRFCGLMTRRSRLSNGVLVRQAEARRVAERGRPGAEQQPVVQTFSSFSQTIWIPQELL